MPFSIQTQRITGNQSATFEFNDKIGALVYGITRVQLTINGIEVSVQTMLTRLQVANNTGVGYTSLTLNQTLTLDDIDPDNSWMDVTVLAWIGDDQPTSIFMKSDCLGTPIGVPFQPPSNIGSAPTLAAATLAGWNFSFPNEDSGVLGLGVSTGAVVSLPLSQGAPCATTISAGTMTGSAAMTGTTDTGLLVFTEDQDGVWTGGVSDQSANSGDNTLSVPGSQGVNPSQTAIFLQSFGFQLELEKGWPVPQFSSLRVGASNPKYDSTNQVLTFTSSRSMQGYISGYQQPHIGLRQCVASYLIVGLTG